MTQWMRYGAIVSLLSVAWLPGQQAAPTQNAPANVAPSAQTLLDAAIKQAQAEQKNIFVEFGASWCPPCVQLEKFLDAPAVKPIVSNAFVVVRLIVLERGSKEKLNHPGAEELLRQWNNNESSIPFYLVLDRTGQPIPNASGSGFSRPGVSPGVAFVSLLERTSTSITPAARRTLLDYFVVPTARWTSTSQQLVWTETGRLGTSGLTPDGRWGAFTDGSQLFMREFATGAEKRVADLPGTGLVWRRQVFSPDGRQVAFVWINRASMTQQLQVVDVSSDTAATPRVLLDPGPSVDVVLEDWSREAGFIAVNVGGGGGAGPVRQGVISLADGSFRQLNEVAPHDAGNRMIFAPTGHRLAMQLPDSGGSSDVWVVSLDGKTRFPAAVGPGDERPVGWSRDGRHLLYSSDRSGSPALWAVEVQAAGVGDAQVVSSHLGRFDHPLGLDDAGNLYYRTLPFSNTTSILRLDPKATEIASALPDGGPALPGVVSQPAWSADGQSVAYVQDLRGAGGRLRLIIRNVATDLGKELNPDIPRFGPMSGHLRWSPDGRTLMYIWDGNFDGSRMYAIDVQTGSTKLVASTDQWYSGSEMLPERSVLRLWTGDNKLYFDRGVGQDAKAIAVIEHDLASGHEREVFRGPDGWVHRLAIAPDGGTAYYKRPAGDGKTPPQDLVARDLRTGAERVLVARQHFDDLNLSPDGRFLFFAMREDPASKERMFAVVPTAGGAPRRLPAMGMFYSWLPDATGIIARSDGPWDESTHYVLVPLDGSKTRPIAALGSDPIGISVSPTGAHLAFHQWPSTSPPSQIWRMDLRLSGGR